MNFVKILLASLTFIAFSTVQIHAVDIRLDNTIDKIQGDNDNTTCHVGDIFRLGTAASYNGQPLDLLVEITAEDNEYDELNIHTSTPCISADAGILNTRIRDRDQGDNHAFMDFKFTVVARDTMTPVKVDRIVFAGLDLDKSNSTSGSYLTGTDNVYIKSPVKAFIQSDGHSDVSYNEGNYGSSFDKELLGRDAGSSSNCEDYASSPQPECRGGGIAIEGSDGPNQVSSIEIRVANDNAYGMASSSRVYRLIQLSFKESDFEAMLIDHDDHGDIPASYGDARHQSSVFTVLGYGYPADNEEAQYSTLANLDDNPTAGGINFDDEDGVRLGGTLLGSEFNMTVGYTYDLNVTTIGTGYLSIWVDLDGDGTFGGSDEKLLSDQLLSSVVAKNTIIPLALPATTYAGRSYIRFRFSETQGVEADGNGGKGEVEDYTLFFLPSGTVSGRIYNDKNGNGIQEDDERGFQFVKVAVTAGNGETQIGTTNADGDYHITYVAAGEANVKVDESTLPAGAVLVGNTDPSTLTVIGDQDNDAGKDGYQLQANLVTTKSADNSTAKVGDTVTFTITVSNQGEAEATFVSLTDALPAGITYVGATPSQGDYDKDTGVWDIGSLNNGSTVTLTLTGTVDLASANQTLTNITTPASTPNQFDPSTEGDDLEASITVDTMPTVTFRDANATEGEQLSFYIELSEPSTHDTHISIHTEDGTATHPDDYAPVSGIVTIPAGDTLSPRIPVQTNSDPLDEPNETVIIYGTVTSGNTANTDINGTGIIIDNTEAPTIEMAGASAIEGEDVVFSITLSNPSSTEIVLNLDTQDGTATAGDDYQAVHGLELTIPAGSTGPVTISVATFADSISEQPDENFTLKGHVASGNTANEDFSAPGTIIDNTGKPTVEIASASATEGTDLVFSITLNHPSSVDTTLTVSTQDGTATAGEDYNTTDTNVTIPAGSTGPVTVSVPTLPDNIDEPDETLTLAATVTSGNTANESIDAAGTIIDNTDKPTVEIAGASATEGTDLVFSVTLSNPSSVDTTLTVSTQDGTATAGEDYNTTNTNVTIPAGSTGPVTVSVPTIDDPIEEDDEERMIVNATVTSTNTNNTAIQALGTILDNDDPAVFSISATEATEGDPLIFDINISSVSDKNIYVVLNTADESANSGTDYVAALNWVMIPAGETGVTFTVQTIDDALRENPEETLTLKGIVVFGSVSNPNAEATGTILDNDSASTVQSVTDDNATEGADLRHTVVMSSASDSNQSYAFDIIDETTSPEDHGLPTFTAGVVYDSASGTIIVPANTTTFDVLIPALQDDLYEDPEQYSILVGDISATGTIKSCNKEIKVDIISDSSVAEGADLNHTVIMSGLSANEETYLFSIIDDTTSSDDYNATPEFSNNVAYDPNTGMITVPAETMSFDIIIHTTADTVYEGNESYAIEIGDADAQGTISDDGEPSFTISDANVTEGEDLVFTVTLSGESSDDTYIVLRTIDMNATSPQDFSPRADWIKIPAGETQATFTVHTADDELKELPIEDMKLEGTVFLGTISNDTASGTGFINDNEGPIEVLSVSSSQAEEGEDLVHEVTLSGLSVFDESYAYHIDDSNSSDCDCTATAGEDFNTTQSFTNGVTYDSATQTLLVPHGVTHFEVIVSTIDDEDTEDDIEFYHISIGGISGEGDIKDGDGES